MTEFNHCMVEADICLWNLWHAKGGNLFLKAKANCMDCMLLLFIS